MVFQIYLKVVGDTSALSCEITPAEIDKAIKSLHVGKSPGCNGPTATFYKYFSDQLTDLLSAVLIECFQNKSLMVSQYLAVIILLFKKGQQSLMTNYRPILLTYTNYKILAYVLTNRLEEHLSFLISLHQTAYMKGRFIGMNIRSVQDMITDIEETGKEHLVLFLDFCKAFDSISHLFLKQLLLKIGLPSEFVEWVDIIYAKANSVV